MDLSELSSSTMLKAASIGNTLLIAGAVLHKDVGTAAILQQANRALWHLRRAGERLEGAQTVATRFEQSDAAQKLLDVVAMEAGVENAIKYNGIPLAQAFWAMLSQSRGR